MTRSKTRTPASTGTPSPAAGGNDSTQALLDAFFASGTGGAAAPTSVAPVEPETHEADAPGIEAGPDPVDDDETPVGQLPTAAPAEVRVISDPRCGLIAIVGRPNVGKSTLLNTLVGQKVSITSRKAQTTRHRITGISTQDDTQYVFVDTPGFQTRHTVKGTAALNRNLNKTVQGVLSDVDVVLFVVEAGRFGLDDAKVLSLVPPGKPTVLVANKLDLIQRRADLMPWLKQMQDRHPFAEFVPLTAKKEDDARRLLGILRPYLPEQGWFYDSEALTDRSEKFLAAELIREKLFRLTGDELPYTSTVQIDKFEDEGRLRRIAATVIVERDSHKGIVIGEGGERLKRIGMEARTELERLTGGKVFLELWVKVRSGWADDEQRLKSYGYE
ncbi:GTP-binding protein Era [Sphaerotilus hippei]|uniref:GTPase Era n=1 Tax=Sphaerotilus hippei TaxID=744406 RepID=A0A318H1H4_9BURK|nr:GTPase Era [Sphaerotilus hippei]PXW97033.1 GTP-binding protein Era [Sphaerotilus hippei]